MLILSGKSAENHAYLLVISDGKSTEISVEFPLNFSGNSTEIQWNFSSISELFKLKFRHFSSFIQCVILLKFITFGLISEQWTNDGQQTTDNK